MNLARPRGRPTLLTESAWPGIQLDELELLCEGQSIGTSSKLDGRVPDLRARLGSKPPARRSASLCDPVFCKFLAVESSQMQDFRYLRALFTESRFNSIVEDGRPVV